MDANGDPWSRHVDRTTNDSPFGRYGVVILVTGGTGFIGRHLVRRLLADGLPVRVLTRSPPASPAGGAEYVRGDLRDDEAIRRSLDGVGTVVHLAARLEEAGAAPEEFEVLNVSGTARLARHAREAGVARIVHLSSGGVYGNGDREAAHREEDPPRPSTPYERSKLLSEGAMLEALEPASTSWVILRPAGVYGPGRQSTADFFRQIATRRVWLHGGARVIVHPTFVDDVVQAIALAMTRPEAAGMVINIAGARMLPFPDLVALIGSRLGRSPVQAIPPRWVGAAAGAWLRASAAGGLPGRRVAARLASDIIHRGLDTTRARTLLSFSPGSLEEGIDRTIAWLRSEGRL